MITELTIDPGFESLLPKLTQAENEGLEQDSVKSGRIRDAIVYWPNGGKNIVVGGHHRLKIAHKHNLPYDTLAMEFASREEAELWILMDQANRRNLGQAAQRELRGEIYVRITKTSKKQGRTPFGHFGQTDDTKASVAKKIAKKTGVSERTVRRDGARVEALKQCEESLRKGVNSGAIKMTDAEVKTVSKLPPDDQAAVATELRMGRASNVNTAMKSAGVKAPKPKRKQPPKQLDRQAYFKQWDNAIGPLVRLVDKIANGVGESKSKHHNAVQKLLNDATETMMEWMGVAK